MQVFRDVGEVVAPAGGAAVTIGAYDGVHLGHRHVLGLLADLAAKRGLADVVVTFDRHPATVVRPQSAPLVLTDLEQKLELLEASGVQYTLVLPFDETRSQESAEDFVTEVLVGALGVRVVVVGRDFHFGHDRKGNVAMLQEMGADHGFETIGIALAEDAAGAVSSTRIRRLLAQGDARGAAALLGRHHQVRGMVVTGDGRGASLGVPTANVDVPGDIALPAEGIYAGLYRRPDGTLHHAAIGYGRRPTFYAVGGRPLLEAHLVGFSGDLYGEPAQVSFVERLRGEERFDTADALVAQMRADVEQADAVLKAEAPTHSP